MGDVIHVDFKKEEPEPMSMDMRLLVWVAVTILKIIALGYAIYLWVEQKEEELSA